MIMHVSHASPYPDDENFDLNHIFIGRENELDLFEARLLRWKTLMSDADPDVDTALRTRPSPNNKLQGLVILLYGHGGFGKSTLLRRFYDITRTPEQHIQTGKIIDWEFEVEEKRGLFNPSPDQKIDAFEYYRLLFEQLAFALEKMPKDFRMYQSAVKAVEQARKRANSVLDRMQGDDQYAALRGVTIDALVTLIGSVAPSPISTALGNEKAKAVVNEGVKIGGELISQAYTKLRDELGNTFGDYLDAPLRLGLALGHDLHEFAKNFPMLIFFDTYEEIDTADTLLRVVMGAASLRVGWVLAGRDNLWGGLEQRKRSITKEYSYKDILIANRSLAIDFNVGGVGAFTLSDVQDYFDQLCQHTHFEPSLPDITEEEAELILQTTQGIPLAVSIAAALYRDTGDVKLVVEKADNQREIVDQMVERYLLHARDDLSDRYKLYGLALLRRPDNPTTVAVALGLNEENMKGSYEQELSRLHRRYSFIFTEKEQPSLHQEVRHFLRLWLLERYKEPLVRALNEQLSTVQEDMLKKLEERRKYTTLQHRLQDDEWVEIYLSLAEQQFWLDSVEGIRYLIPFMLAAAIYRRKSNDEVVKLGQFFSAHFRRSFYMDWWAYAPQCLVSSTSRGASEDTRDGLNRMTQLTAQNCLSFPPVLPDFSLELEAALWWRLGEAYKGKDEVISLRWYEKALTRLNTNSQLKEAASQTAWNVAHKFYEEKKYSECIPFLSRAIELMPDYKAAYINRGVAYRNLKEYQRAIEDYNQTIALDPQYAMAYNNRGWAYANLKEYQRAIEDYNQAIALDPRYAMAYNNRGNAYADLKEYQRAIEDYNQTIALDPQYAMAYNNRGRAYADLKEYQRAIEDYNQAIALDPQLAIAYRNRGNAYRNLKHYHECLADLKQAFVLDETLNFLDNDLGLAFSYNGRYADAIDSYEKRLKKDPDNYTALYNKAVAIARWQGLSIAQSEIEKARVALLTITDTNLNFAVLYGSGGLEALLGNTEEALDYLQKAIALNEETIDWARHDVAWLDLHSYPQFLALIT